ncbi:hypothetical protein DL96DRAFT_866985 [Flagelloscypha sp. PMI_526]|nr:hypothetical protein DL96DRAFT_866985 [Flagelloscypha sp. PMI_526]
MRSLPRFEYAITRPFPWRWYTASVVFASILLLALLTILNLATVGYEPVTIISNDYNSSQNFWWTKFSQLLEPGGSCEPKAFSSGDALQTNTSAFSYTVQSVDRKVRNSTYVKGLSDPSTEFSPFDHISAFSYHGQSLEPICFEMHPTNPSMPFLLSRPTISSVVIESLANYLCEIPEDETGSIWKFYLSAKYTWSLMSTSRFDDPDTTPGTGLGPILRGVLDGVAEDLMTSILQMNTDAASVETIALSYNPSCANNDWKTCQSQPLIINSTASEPAVTLRNGTIVYDSETIPASVRSAIGNFLAAWGSVTRADLGWWGPGSIFVGDGMLNQTITAGADGANALRSGINQFSNNFPLQKDKMPPQTVISTFYSCHGKRRKAAGNLVVSILSSNLSMFFACWGVLVFFASYMAKRKHDSFPTSKHSDDDFESEAIPLYRRSVHTASSI